ncbi:MAG: peptide deformylase [Candidatus Roizmanbacteria bacterium]
MLKIVTVPNNILSSPTKPVTKIDDKIKTLLIDMEKILLAQNDPKGVGLSANQVGVNLSIFIIKPSEKAKTKVFINPKIIKKTGVEGGGIPTARSRGVLSKRAPAGGNPRQDPSRKKKPVKLEGCLSIPRIWGPIKRAKKILLEYQDLTPGVRKKWFQGFEATIIQHEIDHLQGVVFTQRSLEQNQPVFKEEGDELVKVDLS